MKQLLAERLTAQLLAGEPAGDPVAVARRLLVVQGQDPRGVRLAVRARTTGLTAADVDRALTEERSLIITTLNRGTLHLVASEDYPWLHALTTPQLMTASTRRLSQEGVSPAAAERGVATIERSLASEGPLTRAALRERLQSAGVPTAGQALVHVLALAALRGLTVRGPMIDGEQAHVLVADWLKESGPVDRDAALGELARRYLAGHAPADARDLARWAGITLSDARRGLSATRLRERPDGLVELLDAPAAGRMPPPRLLGSFDPLLLGWRSRELILAANRAIVTVNGLFRPFALARGRAVATWRLAGGELTLEPFAALSRADRRALEADARDVRRYLGIS